MSRRILALSEGLGVSGEALSYADALSRRMEGALVLLMLLPLDLDPARSEASLTRRGEALLTQRLEELALEASAVERHVLAGDPWSELCKFAALHGPFQIVVWASQPDSEGAQTGWSTGQWLVQIREALGCPVITAQRRLGSDSIGGEGRRR